jgi:hypothetical protein
MYLRNVGKHLTNYRVSTVIARSFETSVTVNIRCYIPKCANLPWTYSMAGCAWTWQVLCVMQQFRMTGEARRGRSGRTGFWEAGEKLAECHLLGLFYPLHPLPAPKLPRHHPLLSCSCFPLAFTAWFSCFHFIRLFFILVTSSCFARTRLKGNCYEVVNKESSEEFCFLGYNVV